MSKERTDEFLKWRGLLDRSDAGLDQVLDDREATWHRLAGRLGERRRNRLYGYRIAAACLLFVLIIPASRLFPDRHTATGARRQPTPDLSSAPQRAAAPSAPFRPGTAGQQRLSHQAQETARRARASKASARKTDRTPLPALIDIGAPPASIVAAPPDPAIQSLFPPSSPAKQLKVVHQNEIRGGSILSPAVSVTTTKRLIDLFRPFPQQPSAAAPPAEDPALLKIKLSPSN